MPGARVPTDPVHVARGEGFTIRSSRPGDLGWTFHRQAAVYAREFRYSPVFERYVAHGLAPFLDKHDPRLDHLWMAQDSQDPPSPVAALGADGGARILGFIAVQHDPDRTGWAKLRWFLVEREARGRGVGRALMQTALDFCRKAGYEGIYLWTVDDLHDARRVYERSGFTLAFQDPKPCEWAPWGHEQRWELRL